MFKYLKWIIALAALMAFPSMANAACTYQTGAIYHPVGSHNLDIPQEFTGCNGVDMIRFLGADYGTGVWDLTAGGPINPISSRSVFQNDHETPSNSIYDIPYNVNTGSAKMWDHMTCWFFGGTHWVKNQVRWRWRATSTGIWSSLLLAVSPPYPLAC